MTTQEFSNMFDTLLNSYANKSEFGDLASMADITLDEYEKSVLLTQALDIVVKSFFSRESNAEGRGFDDSIRRQVDFSSLITVASTNSSGDNKITTSEGEAYDERGQLYRLPNNVLLILNEKIIVKEGKEGSLIKKPYVVVPINYKEYDRLMSKAYSLPLKKQCWRLFQNDSGIDIISEIIPIEGTSISDYKIRYIRRPRPIVLENLHFENQESLDIDGVSEITQCELNPILHMEILNKAVEIALTTRGRVQPLKLL